MLSDWKKELLQPSWANLQLWLVMVMLIAANLSIAVSQLALGLALLVQVWRVAWLKESLASTGLGRWLMALAIWALLMIPFSSDPGQSLVFYKRFFLFAAVWVTAESANGPTRRWLLLVAVILGAVSISLYAQFSALAEAGSLFKIRMGLMSNSMTSGCLLMMSVLLMAAGVIWPRCPAKVRLALGLAALPVVLALVQTMTRSAWLGTLAGLAVMLVLTRPRLSGVFLLAAVVILVTLPRLPDGVLSPSMKQRFDVGYLLKGNSTNQRVMMWNEGWAMLQRHPITGVGDRDLKAIGPEYYQHENMHYYGHLHSNPVMLAAIWGVPGLILGMGFLFRQLWLLLSRWRAGGNSSDDPAALWVLGGIGIWAGFFLAGLTEWYFGDAESMLLYLAITGVGLGAPLNVTGPGSQ